jgi:hypothetical protein
MGLDVYVGSLTRYYAGDWETIVQQAGREQGFEVRIERWNEPADPITDPQEIQEIVDAWRNALGEALGRELSWNEKADSPYYTDKPAWDGYGSLQVLAAYEDRGKEKRPKRAVTEWHRDKQWRKAAEGASPRYPHLYGAELWLPVELESPFRSVDAAGNDVGIASSIALLRELRALNDRTYGGSTEDVARWRQDGAEPEGPFDDAARFGLAVFLELTQKSVEEQLPMRLDY